MSKTNYGNKRLEHLEQMVERNKKFPTIKLNGDECLADLMGMTGVPKPKQCPFCGGRTVSYINGGKMVVCVNDDCLAAGPHGGDTTQEAVEMWNTRPWVKHLELMIESHMNIIDKQLASIKELEQEARVGEERFAELEGYYRAAERIIKRMNEEYKELEAQTTPVCERGVTRECEHEWRTSPYDAGLTFCRLCGIEHS